MLWYNIDISAGDAAARRALSFETRSLSGPGVPRRETCSASDEQKHTANFFIYVYVYIHILLLLLLLLLYISDNNSDIMIIINISIYYIHLWEATFWTRSLWGPGAPCRETCRASDEKRYTAHLHLQTFSNLHLQNLKCLIV